ncbi:hypothetical protein D9M71_731010 [compost metagenome]
MMGTAHFAGFQAAGLAPRQQRRHRYATAKPFAEHDDIGPHTEGLFSQQAATATDTGLHLVEDQQDAQLATQALDPLEVMCGSRNHPSFTLDRLEHDRHGPFIHRRIQRRKIVEGDATETR